MSRMAVATGSLALVAGAISWPIWGLPMALGIALGALLGLANVLLLASGLRVVVSQAAAHRPSRAGGFSLPAILLVKWPIVLLALGFVLWYLPARPEGVAAGVVLSLVAASWAARPS